VWVLLRVNLGLPTVCSDVKCTCLLLGSWGATVAWYCCQGFVVQVSLCVCVGKGWGHASVFAM
jgi:hypothetical protein